MKDLSYTARVYILAMLNLGAAVTFSALPLLPHGGDQWLLFTALALGAAAAQLFPVVTPKNQAYYLTLVFIFAGIIVLPPGPLVLLIIFAFIPEWIKIRYRWYIQLFNIANFLVDAYVARTVYLSFGGVPGAYVGIPGRLAAAVVAAVAFTVLNHLLLAVVLHQARGHSWRETGLFEAENFLTDAALCATGIIAALLCELSPWLLLVMAAPLLLIHRALNTPNLQEQARTDDKTGLYNARHFYDVLREELRRASRFERPLAVIMADMDLLRNINNTYGHLAGDVVLKGVAQIIKSSLREYDLAARFGGEEFAVLLPETDAVQAMAVAERLRKQVGDAEFSVSTSPQPIRVTLSLGVAAFPAHGRQAEEVIHQADLAVYYAKLRGRNRAWACSPESRALAVDMAGRRGVFVPPEDVAWLHPAPSADYPVAPQTPHAGQPARGDDLATGRAPVNAEASGHERGAEKPGENDQTGAQGHREGSARTARRRERASDLTWRVGLLVAILAAATGVLWVTHRPWAADLDWPGIAAVAMLAVAAQSMAIDIYGRGKVSTSAILVLAGGALFGIPGALLLAPAVAGTEWVLRRGPLYRSVFDLGGLSLSAAASAAVYGWASAPIPASQPLLLLVPAWLAALTYYVVNVGLLSVAMGLNEKRSPIAICNERFRWLLAHYLVYGVLSMAIALAYSAVGLLGLVSFFVPPVMLRYVMKQYIDHTEGNVAELTRVNQELVKAHHEVIRTLGELRATYDATIMALSAAMDSRDSETEGHSRRVVEYAAAIARRLGLSQSEVPGLLNGALLHDVGKIGMPDAILRKPGPLSQSEWGIMRTHPDLGCKMLRHIGFLRDALPIVRHHHERFDGSGYPDGLRGEEIPLGARIFAVADALDAMTSHRPYRTASSFEAAREEIVRCSGSHFDPRVVAAFLEVGIEDLAKLGQRAPQAVQPQEGESSPGSGPKVVSLVPNAA